MLGVDSPVVLIPPLVFVLGAEGVVVGAGVLLTQTEGCPEQVYPGWIWHPTHPAE